MEQLKMFWNKQPLAEAPIPEGYVLRTYQKGDEAEWIRLCSENLGTNDWSYADFEEQMLHRAGICPEGIFFLFAPDGRMAASATGILPHDDQPAFVHMVIANPEFRGLGLAKVICTVVMNYLVDHGCELVALTTDEFRIPAIKAYLRLGFLPALHFDDMQERWTGLLPDLKLSSLNTVLADGVTPGAVLEAK